MKSLAFPYSLFFLFCMLVNPGQVSAQFEKINARSEIHQSIIYSIAQDSFGNIWAGTEEGIIRYNSRESFLYNKYRGIKGNIQNRTSKILIDSRARIWSANAGGIFLYEPMKDEFIPILPDARPAPSLIKDMAEDNRQRIWVGAFNGLWTYDPNAAESNQKLERVFGQVNIHCLRHINGVLYIGSNNGLYIFIPEKEQLTHIPLSDSEMPLPITSITTTGTSIYLGSAYGSLIRLSQTSHEVEQVINLPLPNQKNTPVNGILVDPENNLFVGTDGGGLLHLSEAGNLIRRYANDPNLPGSISSDGIYDLLIGMENILWLATYGGGINYLNLAQTNFYRVEHRLNDRNSLAHNFTRAILEDSEGLLWFGTREGISIWNRETGRWKQIPSLQNPSSDEDIVMALAEDGQYIWAGTYGRGAFRIDKNNLNAIQFGPDSPGDRRIDIAKVYAILVDEVKNVWIGGINEELHCIRENGEINTYPIEQVRDIIQQPNGSILVAGRNGVQRIDEDSVFNIEILQSGHGDLQYTTVTSLLEDQDGNLLVGTNGSGLIVYDQAENKTRIIDPTNGLPSDIVQGILEDEIGQIWVSTTSGVVKLTSDRDDPVLRIYDQGDGLISNIFNFGSYARLSDGTLAFGGPGGVIMFNPLNINTQTFAPDIFLEDFQLLETEDDSRDPDLPQNINFQQAIGLKHFQNAFRIRFIGILHSSPEKVSYSWKMEGLNEQWSQPNEETQINFINLSPGTYTFSVKAANRDGIWGKEKKLKITIAPPWWATSGAYAIYAILAVGLLSGLVYISNVLIRKRNADEQIAFFSNITHELKTPLSVLLSSLENASQERPENGSSNEKIRTTIKRLNTLFEQLLNFNKITSDKHHMPEVSKVHLESYVENILHSFKPLMEEKQISARVINNWEKDIFYYDREVLDKILFNLVSNAIKYSNKEGDIQISLAEAGKDSLRLEIKDNGIGIPKDQQKFILKRYYRGRNAVNSQLPGTGLGLMIVKNLIERDKGSISFESTEKKGTTFTVILKNQPKLYKHSAILKSGNLQLPESRDTAKLAEYSDAKILIVEDNDELRQILVEELGTYFQVYEAHNGKEGLKKVESLYPDLVITDLVMPEMDGIELCERLQADINLNHILVFMMTVLSSAEYKLKSIESGVTAFLEKPIDINFLLAKIISTFDWQKKLHERYKHNTEIEDAENFRNKRDAEFLSRLEAYILEKIKEENLSVHDLCNFLGMSRTALYMKLKNLVDLSPQNFIIHTRLKYARKLLIEQNMTIKEVAYQSGFSNPKYFSTSFKKLFSESPSSFLKSLHAE